MSHTQTIPAKTYNWEHHRFFGRRIGSPADVGTPDELLRNWGVLYQAFMSAGDAKYLRNPVAGLDCNILVKGELVDRFFHSGTAYIQDDARVVACLAWYLTGNPTQAELDKTENMEHVRSVMAGAVLFPGTPAEFTVTTLPEERASE